MSLTGTLPGKSLPSFRFKEECSLQLQSVDNIKWRKDDDLVGKDRCLAVCNETGVLALAKGVEIVIAWLKYIQESTEKWTEYKQLIFPKQVQNFGFHKHGDVLFVQLQQEAKLFLYSVAALFQNKTEPFQTISLSSVPLRIWTITEEEYLYCGNSNQIERVYWPNGNQVLFHFSEQIVDLVCSPDGKRVATITKDAKLQFWDEKGSQLDERNLSIELPLPSLDLFWIQKTSLFIMLHRSDGGMLLMYCGLDTNGRIRQVDTYSSVFIETPDCTNNRIAPFGMMQVIEEWQIFILGVSYSTDIQVIYKEEEQLYLLSLEEGEEISCPVDEQGQDTYPLGLALDWTNTRPVRSKTSAESNSCAMPRLLLLLSNDTLKYYSVIDSRCIQPCNKIRSPKAPSFLDTGELPLEKIPGLSTKGTSKNATESELDSHTNNISSKQVDVNTVVDQLTNKMQQLFLQTNKKLDDLVDSVPQEIVDRRMLKIDALYQDCKIQSRKLLQRCDQLHKEWIEQVMKQLEECEKMRLEEERILFNKDESEITLQEWIHPEWKEMEQQIEQRQHEIQKAMNYIEEFLEKVYRDRKAAHHQRDTSGISLRRKIFQSLYVQRKRLETLYSRFQAIEREYLNRWTRSSPLASSSLKEPSSVPLLWSTTSWKDINAHPVDVDSVKKSTQLIYEMAMKNGRDDIRPQQHPLEFPKVKKHVPKDNNTKLTSMEQDKTSSYLSKKNTFTGELSTPSNSSSLSFVGKQSSTTWNTSLKTSLETPITSKKEEVSFENVSGKEHSVSETKASLASPENSTSEKWKDNFMSKLDSISYGTVTSSRPVQENKDERAQNLNTNFPGNSLQYSSTSIQSSIPSRSDKPSLEISNEDTKEMEKEPLQVRVSDDKPNDHKTFSTEKNTRQVEEMKSANFATSDTTVVQSLDAMDFSNDKQSEINTSAQSQTSTFKVQNNPFGGFSQVTSGASFGSHSGGFSSISSMASPSWPGSSGSVPSFGSSAQQSFANSSGFHSGFNNSSVSTPFTPTANPFSSAGYQFGSPSSFLSPAAGAFAVSNITPAKTKTTIGFGTGSAFSSPGSNPFASLAQQTATSPVLGSSNNFGSFSSPITSAAFTWSHSSNASSSLPPSFSQMRK